MKRQIEGKGIKQENGKKGENLSEILWFGENRLHKRCINVPWTNRINHNSILRLGWLEKRKEKRKEIERENSGPLNRKIFRHLIESTFCHSINYSRFDMHLFFETLFFLNSEIMFNFIKQKNKNKINKNYFENNVICLDSKKERTCPATEEILMMEEFPLFARESSSL